ncbi:preprotein translocase subunit SecG [Croceicoccus naphthovorans]|uniref:Protein-export membrane protein SecG n=1 Tax=Croceicoccus naphthovorans TaxID=1348774 RepID=A0A0G3XHU3_9SPHN|nr:preprotein translocase subunit SecG [Croceicoccus naphthovorans]AKM09968.1 preprotein translocase subunit SecG [Croceicoccus naphthovorans]MBB3990865.1 preprotein translocase subunit SecG [Croceicoccus naphthovorans]
MSLFLFLTVVQALVGAGLVGVVLAQRSEGGGLGVGGSPSGLMSARGAADFMTRATTILATIFVILSIALAAVSVETTSGGDVDTSLDRSLPINDPLAPAAGDSVAPAPVESAAPASDDPLAGAASE